MGFYGFLPNHAFSWIFHYKTIKTIHFGICTPFIPIPGNPRIQENYGRPVFFLIKQTGGLL